MNELKKKPRWRKKAGTGDHTMPNGTVVKDGDVVLAWPSQLAGAIDKFDPIDYIPNEDGSLPGPPPPESTMTIKHKGAGRWDVIGPDGKPINDAPLSKKDAKSLMNGVIPPLTPEPMEVTDPPESKAVRKAIGKKIDKDKADAKREKMKDKPPPLPVPAEPKDGD